MSNWNEEKWREESNWEHEECYLVAAIKKHLRTPEHREVMYKFDFSIEDMLNGRVEEDSDDIVEARDKIFDDWNKTLGFDFFNT